MFRKVLKGLPNQLNIFEEIEKIETEEKKAEQAEKPYHNGLGQLLPWEEPDYLKKTYLIHIS